MHPQPPSHSFESKDSYIADFLVAFHLNFYIQLGHVFSKKEAQIYRINLGTSDTARCQLSVEDFNNIQRLGDDSLLDDMPSPSKRAFSILLHVSRDNIDKAKLLCDDMHANFPTVLSSTKQYTPDMVRYMPNNVRSTMAKYPVSLRIE
jgi:hypothetical protein